MSARDKPSTGFWVAVIVGLIAPLVIYVGLYLWMVDVVVIAPLWVVSSGPSEYTEPRYKWGPSGSEVGHHRLWMQVFSPVHALDRRMRPAKWAIEGRLPPDAALGLR